MNLDNCPIRHSPSFTRYETIPGLAGLNAVYSRCTLKQIPWKTDDSGHKKFNSRLVAPIFWPVAKK